VPQFSTGSPINFLSLLNEYDDDDDQLYTRGLTWGQPRN